jgi:type VI protein secretion system component VasK
MPARERVYADVKARAATRFPAVTVASIVGDQDKELVLGSYAVPGSFTRAAWQGFVQDAFREAANRELQSADWVLKTSSKDDLTLEGSPEQIQKSLVDLYKNDYAREWQKFVQGVTVQGPVQLRPGRQRHEPPGRSANLAAEQADEHRLRADLVGQPVAAGRRPATRAARRHRLVQGNHPAPETIAGERQRQHGGVQNAAMPLARSAANSPAWRGWWWPRTRMRR